MSFLKILFKPKTLGKCLQRVKEKMADVGENLATKYLPKPKSLGEGLQRVKEKMGAVGENLAIKPGERLYRTPSGDIVTMQTHKVWINSKRGIGDSMHANMFVERMRVQKILAPFNKAENYIGKVSCMGKCYTVSIYSPSTNVFQEAETFVTTFSNKGTKHLFINPIPASEAEIVGMFRVPGSINTPNQELAQKVVVSKSKITRSRQISYEKAASILGLIRV